MKKSNRRHFIRDIFCYSAALAGGSDFLSNPAEGRDRKVSTQRPNILFAIADDWSWPHAGIYGDQTIETPNFDRVAQEGCLFTHAFGAAPQCSPCRAAILTGRNIWQLEEAGTHSSIFPEKFDVYPDLLESAGYYVGYTGKPWGPGSWELGGRKRNPAGVEFNEHRLNSIPASGINKRNYAKNFDTFLKSRPNDQPFCFWYGCHEPHRKYEKGSGLKAGKKLENVDVPPFLPDDPEIRSDILDYYLEIEWFDRQLGDMLRLLEEAGELDHTLVVVTSDNGMPFPRAKANLYDHGTHMPLAIRWPEKIPGGRTIDDTIGFIDFAPTFLEAAGLIPPPSMTGRSFLNELTSGKSGRIDSSRTFVVTGRERHSHARYDNWGYPARAIRTHDYLYIRNFKPDRWPAGAPEPYYDIDASPSKHFMQERIESKLSVQAFGKRPAEELYDIRKDPGCLLNLIDRADCEDVKNKLKAQMETILTQQKDPRMLGQGDIFESYPRFGSMREPLGGFAKRGVYNPAYQK